MASAAPFVSAWKARFGGMDVSEVKPHKALEDDNAKREAVVHLAATYERSGAHGRARSSGRIAG